MGKRGATGRWTTADEVRIAAPADHGSDRTCQILVRQLGPLPLPQTVYIGDCYFEVRDAEEHEKTPVRIASMDAALRDGV